MLKMIILSGSLLWITSCLAAEEKEVSVILHGASVHSGCQEGSGKKAKKCDFNGVNPGVGIDWRFLGDEKTGFVSIRGGGYKDSYYNFAYYAGTTYTKEWLLAENLSLGFGLQGGYLNGSEHHGFVMLPMVLVSYKNVTLEVGYVSKSWGDKVRSNVTMFSLRWGII